MPPYWVWALPLIAAAVAAATAYGQIRRRSVDFGSVAFVATLVGLALAIVMMSVWQLDRSYAVEREVPGWAPFTSEVVSDHPPRDDESRYVTTASGHQVEVDGTRAYHKGSVLTFSCPVRGEGWYGGEYYASCLLSTPTEQEYEYYYPFGMHQVFLPVAANLLAGGLVLSGYWLWVMNGGRFRSPSSAKKVVEEEPANEPL